MSSRAPRPANPRRQLRIRLMLLGVLPLILLAAYSLKVGLMLHHNAAGRDAFDRGDYDGAAAEFTDTRSLNWFESWVAPFDDGASEHAQEKYDEAIASYTVALRSVPHRDECTVRINLSLAHEAVGDAALKNGALEDAKSAFNAGIKALADGKCPTDSGRGKKQTDDAAAVDRRLHNKIKDNESDPQPDDQQDPEKKPPPQDGQSDPRRQRLDEQNKRGQEQRHEDQDLYKDNDYSLPDTW